MQINLKQAEIEVALKNYVSHQGISLYARDVAITFTAGRKESGISAEITIEDSDIPGFGHGEIYLVPPSIPEGLMKSETAPCVAGVSDDQDAAMPEDAVVAVGAINTVNTPDNTVVVVQSEKQAETGTVLASLFG